MDRSVTMVVHVRPRARTSGVVGAHGDALAVRVREPPTEGRANRAVCLVLAEAFSVPVSAVTLRRGSRSSRKLLEIEGDVELLRRRLHELMGGPS